LLHFETSATQSLKGDWSLKPRPNFAIFTPVKFKRGMGEM